MIAQETIQRQAFLGDVTCLEFSLDGQFIFVGNISLSIVVAEVVVAAPAVVAILLVVTTRFQITFGFS